jgi:hypothetical protein
VDADAKEHAPVLRQHVDGRTQLPLDGDRRRRRAGRRLEYGEYRVSGHVDHAAMIGLDAAAEHGTGRVEGGHGSAVVYGHQARIARGVRCEDRHQALPEISRVHLRRLHEERMAGAYYASRGQ